MSSYCVFCQTQPEDSLHRIYHDTQYGFPLEDDNALFGRLILEINQAGLPWNTILRKADNFYVAYDGFAVDKVASYSEQDRRRLMEDAGIVRNGLKINVSSMLNSYWNSSAITVRLKIGSINIKASRKQSGQNCLRKPSNSLAEKSLMSFSCLHVI